ncbi:MAG: Ldh family oxidoreductase [Planctomycetota bacterium]|jgi:LDH2 family malate/lactate/ureidoglycolate dehydrogenase|nr:Ldh family oxidoreductase [Planctomycetota bacterium]
MAGNVYDFKERVVLPHQKVSDWQAAIYRCVGLDAQDARVLAENLVTADLRGVYSHGIQRTPNYVRQFVERELEAKAKPGVIKREGAVAVVDGNNASGIVVATFAAKLAVEIAREFGTSAVSVTRGAHLGACAGYVEIATTADMIGFCWSNGGCNLMAPHGGGERQLGSNPFAIGAPCFSKPAMVLDMATSVVARGKIAVAAMTGVDIPEGWALDADGNPTTDSKYAMAGALLPFGGYKGSGLALMNSVITAILIDSRFGRSMPDLRDPLGEPQGVAHLFQAINIAEFTDVESFKKRMDKVVEYIQGGRKADGFEEIMVPGEPEARARARQLKEGIAYPMEVITRNNDVAVKYGVAKIVDF